MRLWLWMVLVMRCVSKGMQMRCDANDVIDDAARNALLGLRFGICSELTELCAAYVINLLDIPPALTRSSSTLPARHSRHRHAQYKKRFCLQMLYLSICVFMFVGSGWLVMERERGARWIVFEVADAMEGLCCLRRSGILDCARTNDAIV